MSAFRNQGSQRLLGTWAELCASLAVLRFVDVNLRGAGQVMFQNNPTSGALFLAALGWGSMAAGVPHVALGGLTGLVAATVTARCLRADAASFASGSCGFNGLLTGLALSHYLDPGMFVLPYAALGGAVTGCAVLGPVSVKKPWSVPAHTYPFVLTTWIFLLATYGFHGLAGPALPSGAPLDPAVSDPLQIVDFLQGVLHSISQVFFKGDSVSALLLLAGLAVNSPAAAAFAAGGAVLAVVTAHLFGVESELVTSGVQGFSPVLTAIAFGTVFFRPGLAVAAYAAFATVFTVIVQSALTTALQPLALSPLSAPFDLAAWVLLRLRRAH